MREKLRRWISGMIPASVRSRLRVHWMLHHELAPKLLHAGARPCDLPSLAAVIDILLIRSGFLRSLRAEGPVSAEGEPIPWYTYPAIELLQQLNLKNLTVFEYGCGHSTLFWSRRAQRVVSVEHSPEWFERVRRIAPPNCDINLVTNPEQYIHLIDTFDEQFDIIVIDGDADEQRRFKACRAARGKLAPGGFMILDNADWLPASAEFLRSSGLLEVDLAGFSPGNRYISTTSIFFDRQFDAPPIAQYRPVPGVGAVHQCWEAFPTSTAASKVADSR